MEEKESYITDVVAKSIGVENEFGNFEVVINKGRNLPVKKARKFSNAFDNQTTIDCAVYEGEKYVARDNTYLASLQIDIPPSPRNALNILVRVSITKDGLLSGEVLCAGEKRKVEIVRNYGDDESRDGGLFI